MGRYWEDLAQIMETSLEILGRSWGDPGEILGRYCVVFGEILGRYWEGLRRSLGDSAELLGRSWGDIEDLLGRS